MPLILALAAATACVVGPTATLNATFTASTDVDNACNHMPLTNVKMLAGLGVGVGWQAGGQACGMCLQLTNEDSSTALYKSTVVVQVVDNVADGALNLNEAAFATLFGSTGLGSAPVSYAPVSCTSLAGHNATNAGNLRYRFKWGTRSPSYPELGYVGLAVDNSRLPITSVKVRNANETAWTTCPFNGANDYCFPQGLKAVPFEVQVTGQVFGGEETVTDTISAVPECADEASCAAAYLESKVQFMEPSRCAPAKPTPAPAKPTPAPGKPTPAPAPGKPTPAPAPTPTPEPACAQPCFTGSQCSHANCCQAAKDGSCYDLLPATAGSLPSLQKQGKAITCPDSSYGGFQNFCYCPSPDLSFCHRTDDFHVAMPN